MNVTEGQGTSERGSGASRKQSHRLIPWNISSMALGPFRGLFKPPQRLVGPYVGRGQVAADLGCHTGFYSFVMAESARPEGKIYAIDLNEKSIQKLEKRKAAKGYGNIEAHACSASDLGFIRDKSVDFVLANGLL